MTRILQRAAAVLRELSRRAEPAGVNDLARAVSLSPATVYRLLIAMVAEGLVSQDAADAKYQIGRAVIPLAVNYLNRAHLGGDCLPIMRKLAEAAGETVNLGVLNGSAVYYVQQVEGSNPLRFGRDIGPSVPVYCSALGKMFLALMADKERESLLRTISLERRTKNTITSKRSLARAIESIRKQGYAVDMGENIPDLVGLAAPIWDFSGSLVAGLSLMGPLIRMDDARRSALIPQLIATANSISSLSGWTPARATAGVV